MSVPTPVELTYRAPGFLRDAFRVARKDLLIEFRTRSADNAWSAWVPLTKEPGTQMRLENGAVAWQYRLTFFANDPAKSPQVRSVSMTAKTIKGMTKRKNMKAIIGAWPR